MKLMGSSFYGRKFGRGDHGWIFNQEITSAIKSKACLGGFRSEFLRLRKRQVVNAVTNRGQADVLGRPTIATGLDCPARRSGGVILSAGLRL